MKLWDYFSLKIEFSFPLKMLKVRLYLSFFVAMFLGKVWKYDISAWIWIEWDQTVP